MKALVLAGGLGTRLWPLAHQYNKHLLPVAGIPMIVRVIKKAVESGLTSFVIISNVRPDLVKDIVLDYFGHKQNLDFTFVAEKEKPKGIACSILESRVYMEDNPFIVLFGDVLYDQPFTEYVNTFNTKEYVAKFMLAKTIDPSSHASVVFDSQQKIVEIIEKCKDPQKNIIVTSCDIFTSKVWQYFHLLKPSKRGEYEITDLRNMLIKNHKVEYAFVKGWWIDAGTPERLKEARAFFIEKRK